MVQQLQHPLMMRVLSRYPSLAFVYCCNAFVDACTISASKSLHVLPCMHDAVAALCVRAETFVVQSFD